MSKKLDIVGMVEKFQCPGCSLGHEPKSCVNFVIDDYGTFGSSCRNHYAGTLIAGIGRIALGLPVGFNRYGGCAETKATDRMVIRLHPNWAPPWDRFNVPVWKVLEDNILYVRTYSPRNNFSCVDVIQNGALNDPMLENTIDVGQFHDEID
jgi:hypothetical protein